MLSDVVRHRKNVSAFGRNVLNAVKPDDRDNLKKVARQAGVSYNTFYNWLYGKHLPDGTNLMRIAAALGQLVDELLVNVSDDYDKARAIRLQTLGVTLADTTSVSTAAGTPLPREETHRPSARPEARTMHTSDPTFLNLGALGARLTDDERAVLELRAAEWIIDLRTHGVGGAGARTGTGGT